LDKPKIKITADGSHTLYVPNLDETYHSVHGAIQEAIHVYINAGFNYFSTKKELNILEVGFGTGLNTLLTNREALKDNKLVNYTSIEAYPLAMDSIKALNYLEELNATEVEEKFFLDMHKVEWGIPVKINELFCLEKLNLFLENFSVKNKYDVVYFDAFGPRVQPELWEVKILRKMYEALVDGGVLATYCAKGTVKRALKEVGFTIQSIPGPPGKREMTRAIKSVG
jgi:tRNA U34 5-methylaminomethyl-2-thiouridine-forming methyltransferase MnmC